ncbi:MAG: acyltransferase [Flavobacteriales bacterium]|nr:acyltransferase [Flavobacteriales bacterium]
MDRDIILKDKKEQSLYNEICDLHKLIGEEINVQYKRSLPFADVLLDRWERARDLGFGEGSSIYDSSYVFGDVKVGVNTWIGQFTIIEGTGGLTIGDYCTISSAVHIYTHDNIKKTLTRGKHPLEFGPVRIGDGVYIGPQSIIAKGVTIGNYSVIASNSFVKSDFPPNSIVAGNPAKLIGTVIISNDEVKFEYS